MIQVQGQDCWPSRAACLCIGLGRNTMLKALRDRGVFNEDNLPTDYYTTRGYFIVEEKVKNDWIKVKTTYFTRSGLAFVEMFLQDLKPKKPEGEVCYTCRFWVKDPKKQEIGNCFRSTMFPITKQGHSCKEHEYQIFKEIDEVEEGVEMTPKNKFAEMADSEYRDLILKN